MESSESIYTPLDATKSEIRLVEILSDEKESLVKCKLSTVSLNEDQVFSALSYVWGDFNIKANITLEGRTVAVTKNLESALRHVRRHWIATSPDRNKSTFRLWADAICINQEDLAERASQVELMRMIYGSAELVLSWFGPEDPSLAFHTINTIAKEIRNCDADGPLVFSQLDWMRRHPDLCEAGDPAVRRSIKNEAWAAISSFLTTPYWQRVWIFQEVVLATNLLLVGPGDCSLDWDDLELVAERLLQLREGLNKILQGKPKFLPQNVWSAITTPTVSWVGIRKLTMTRSLRKDRVTVAQGESEGWMLSIFAGDLKATDPKDHIYGLLGITGISIKPDYSTDKTIADVYVEYVVGFLEASHRKRIHDEMSPLIFLSNAGIGLFGRMDGFPTWAPNFPKEASGGRSSTRVATAGFAGRGVFNGDGETYPYVVTEKNSLFVWGVKLEAIDFVSEAPQIDTWYDGRMFDFIRDFMSRHVKYPSGIPPLQAFFRLVNRDPSFEVDRLVVVRALAFLRFLVYPHEGIGPIMFERLQSLGFELLSEDFDKQFIDRFFPATDTRGFGFSDSLALYLAQRLDGPIAEVWDRIVINFIKLQLSWRFIETTSGYLGISPVGTEPGDITCVLKECDVPVVLRKNSEEDCYNLVGTTFIVGLMDGEAAEFIRRETIEPQWFELR